MPADHTQHDGGILESGLTRWWDDLVLMGGSVVKRFGIRLCRAGETVGDRHGHVSVTYCMGSHVTATKLVYNWLVLEPLPLKHAIN